MTDTIHAPLTFDTLGSRCGRYMVTTNSDEAHRWVDCKACLKILKRVFGKQGKKLNGN